MFRLLFRLVTDSKQPSVHGNYVSTGIYPFSVFLLSTYPCLCATPRCPWWAAQLRKPFKKIFFSFFFWTFSSFFSFASSLLLTFQIHLCIPLFISTPPFFYPLSPIHPLYHLPHLISIPEHFLLLESTLHSFWSFCFYSLLIEKKESFFYSSYFLCLYISRG